MNPRSSSANAFSSHTITYVIEGFDYRQNKASEFMLDDITIIKVVVYIADTMQYVINNVIDNVTNNFTVRQNIINELIKSYKKVSTAKIPEVYQANKRTIL